MTEARAEEASTENVSLKEAFYVWLKIGVLSFGGPAAQIALMHKLVVEEKRWLSEKQYLSGLSFCMLLPGPEAMQLASYAGWRLHGILGGLIAGLLFVIPGALVVMVLASLYAFYGDIGWLEGVFLGIKAAVIIIVIEALLRVAKKSLGSTDHWVIALLSFIAIFFIGVPYPLIVVAAGLYGFYISSSSSSAANSSALTSLPQHSYISTVTTVLLWLFIWSVPFFIIWFSGGHEFLLKLGAFFSKLAVVTFGGAYAVLAYLGQDVVTSFGWLTAGEMMDGLGLAETTPGPLILVTEFVGFLAGFKEGGIALAVVAALVTLWVTFVPCFLWIFAGAPYIEVTTVLLWLFIWSVPFFIIWFSGGHEFLLKLGAFFSKLAVVTFGGAYAVLAYLGQDVVTSFGWLTAGEMMDGLGLAETTPGPLILVTEFVGFLAGFKEGGIALAVVAALVTLWVTFVPCFLWIFAGAPYIEWISEQPRLKSALSAITAAVVGVILNLSVWFALHVWFRQVELSTRGILKLWVPAVDSLDWRVVVLTILCGIGLLVLHWSVVRVLLLAGALGFGVSLL